MLRSLYIQNYALIEKLDISFSTQIKLITGPRRTGKSTEALLMLKGRNFAYLNFDDGKLLSAWDDDLVWETLRAVYPDFEYLLLDEVQNLDGWHLWVSKLYRMGINMVITGSNAKLLSSEMATLLKNTEETMVENAAQVKNVRANLRQNAKKNG
jgi:predicted AAA+ superfamily ATPase